MNRLFCLLGLCSLSFGAFTDIAGYAPGSDVTEHAKIDLDVEEIETLLLAQNYADAETLYTNGKNSAKSTALRNLAAFSDNSDKLAGEPLADMYAAYWNDDYSYADKFVVAAMTNTAPFVGAGDVAREELALKGIQYQVVWMYVVHELEDAIDDCEASSIADNDAGVHAWDEGWAFYAGSLEGTDGAGSGQLLYALADKRCANFGTCDDNGSAKVNIRLLDLFQAGEQALQQGKCSGAKAILDQIKPLMTIPLVQGALRYAYKADASGGAGGPKEIAEGWAFTAAVLPQVAAVDSAAAATIRKNMEFGATTPVEDGHEVVFKAFYSVFDGLGITCEDVGGLLETVDVYYDSAQPFNCVADDDDASPAARLQTRLFVVASTFVLFLHNVQLKL